MKILCAIACGICTAVICVVRTTHHTTANTIDRYADGSHVTIEGIIAAEPDRRPLQTKYTIAVTKLTDGSGTILSGIIGNVLATDRRQWPQYAYGDTVSVRGILEHPEAIETFRYDNYLSRYGIYTVMYRGSFTLPPTPNPLPPSQRLRKTLYSAKEVFESHINLLFPEPHASFMAGLLTGSRRGIPDTLMEAFNQTGLTHIIAISGYNITMVITIIGSLLFWLPKRLRFYPATLAVIAFTVFVGASAAVVRAAIMGILGMLALQFGRTAHIRLSILWTAFFMTAGNPKILWYDAGFQLSFLAVIGLVECEPMLKSLCKRLPDTLGIRESVQMTIAAQVMAVPVIILLFQRFSLIAPLANLLVAPLIPLAMLCGAVSTLLSFLSQTAGQLLAYPAWLCLESIIRIADLCAAIPFASINIQISAIILIVYYSVLITIRLLTIRKETPSPSLLATEPSSTSLEYDRGTETCGK